MRASRRTLLVHFAICVLASACSESMGEYSLALPNGYHLERYSSGEVTIVAPGSTIAVAGVVQEYAIAGSFIVGRTVVPPTSAENQAKYYSHVRPGYFVVDTSSGEVLLGLSEREWKANLARRNIAVPQLLAPP
jgi:hypothetical protein